MSTTPKAKALHLLQGFLERAEQVKATSVEDEVFRLWIRESEDAVRNLFGKESPQHESLSQIMFYPVQYVLLSNSPEVDPRKVRDQFKHGVENAAIQLKAMLRQIENHWPDDVARPEPGAPLETVLKICDRFPDAVRQLSTRRKGRPVLSMEDEYDVQYLLGGLLVVEFDDVRPENPGPTHAGASSRRDFLLKAERIVVEAKMTRDTLGANEVGEELLVDIARYEAVSDCDTLVCFVYDPRGHILNPRGLERDLEGTPSRLTLRVRVRR